MFQTLGIKTNWKAYSPQHSDLLRGTGVFLLENVVTVELDGRYVLTSAVELGGRHVLTSAGFSLSGQLVHPNGKLIGHPHCRFHPNT